MGKVKMTSKRSHVYGGKRYKIGDTFEATGRSDARLLAAIGTATIEGPVVAPVPVLPLALPVMTRVVVPPVKAAVRPSWPQVQPAKVEPEEKPAPKRFYARRDLTAGK